MTMKRDFSILFFEFLPKNSIGHLDILRLNYISIKADGT